MFIFYFYIKICKTLIRICMFFRLNYYTLKYTSRAPGSWLAILGFRHSTDLRILYVRIILYANRSDQSAACHVFSNKPKYEQITESVGNRTDIIIHAQLLTITSYCMYIAYCIIIVFSTYKLRLNLNKLILLYV